MEEKKKEGAQAPAKLSYEDLEKAAQQLSQQAEALYRENMQLREAVNNINRQNTYAELNFKFKVLDNPSLFSDEFVARTIESIEKTMTPPKDVDEPNTKEAKEEDK